MAAEVAVPYSKWEDALHVLLNLYDFHSTYDRFMNLPLAVRFVKASKHYLSMAHSPTGEPYVFFEILFLRGGRGALEFIEAAEDRLIPLGGRPHWAMFNHLNSETVKKLYPSWQHVTKTKARLDPVGTFNNLFTHRIGLSSLG
jgi:hypothetical protein